MIRPLVLAMAVLLAACAPGYTGPARDFDPSSLRQPGWIVAGGVPAVRQEALQDCGAAAVAMVLRRWGHAVTVDQLTAEAPVPAGGLRAADLRALLRGRGLQSFVVEGTVEDLRHELAANRPVIVGTVKAVGARKALAHYEVVVALHPGRREVVTIDPQSGWRVSPLDGFEQEWAAAQRTTVVALP